MANDCAPTTPPTMANLAAELRAIGEHDLAICAEEGWSIENMEGAARMRYRQAALWAEIAREHFTTVETGRMADASRNLADAEVTLNLIRRFMEARTP